MSTMKTIATCIALAAAGLNLNSSAVDAPKPYGAVPTPRQVAHSEIEMYGFCHFTVDTFTDREWGTGGESETIFNPTAFDANQIVGALKAGGFRGAILTCKHHDGFCLWPTKTTEHCVRNSPWRDGKGDVAREFMKACKRADMKFGVYVSPWDRNSEHYGTPKYVTDVYRPQIRELLTNYGDLFEVWFDGANGGTGYYKGKVGPEESKDVNERRNIDRVNFYDWPTTWQMVRDLMPGACMFSDVGPDVRWCGNESGNAGDTCRSTITYAPTDTPGNLNTSKLGTGELGGKVWCQAEVDVSIRPGWFWHERENKNVRSPENLMQIYLNSVGHGATMLLNAPPDRRGLIHENDAESMKQFGDHLRQTFAKNLAHGAKLTASNVRGGAKKYGPQNLLDDEMWSAWITDDAELTPEVAFELKGEKTFNLIRMREDIRLGLRVEGVAVDAWVDGAWKEIAKTESIGSSHIWRVPKTTTGNVRIRVTKAGACPAISDFGLYLEPEFETWIPPVSGDAKTAQKAKWKVVSTSYEAPGGEARRAIDGNAGTLWHTHGPDGEHKPPQEIVIDLGKKATLAGFTYLPRHDGTTRGIVDQYEFYVSEDGAAWGDTAAKGEFGNIKANPVEQTVTLAKPATGRFIKFVALHSADGNHIAVAELGVVEK